MLESYVSPCSIVRPAAGSGRGAGPPGAGGGRGGARGAPVCAGPSGRPAVGSGRDAEPPAARFARVDQGDARLLDERPVEVYLARVALPGLDADVGGARSAPDGQVGAVGK